MSDTRPPSPDRTITVAARRRRFLTTKQLIVIGLSVAAILFILYSTRNAAYVSGADSGVVSAAAAHIISWTPKKEEPPPPVIDVAAKQSPTSTDRERKAAIVDDNQQQQKGPSQPAILAFTLPPPSPNAGKSRQDIDAGGDTGGRTHVGFKAVALPGLKAGPTGGDDSLTLGRGLIRCVLIDDIISGGPFQCELQAPALSYTNVSLMDRGTIITGHTDANLSSGQDRIPGYGVVAETPTQPVCQVPLGGGPAADGLGAAGMPASVDHYYLERFGPAVAISLTDSLFGLLQSSIQSSSKGNNSYLSLNTGSISSLASEMMRATMNEYKPTGHGHRGDAITIWVTDPIDFSDCYKLVAR